MMNCCSSEGNVFDVLYGLRNCVFFSVGIAGTINCALQWFILRVCFSCVNCCTSCVGFL